MAPAASLQKQSLTGVTHARRYSPSIRPEIGASPHGQKNLPRNPLITMGAPAATGLGRLTGEPSNLRLWANTLQSPSVVCVQGSASRVCCSTWQPSPCAAFRSPPRTLDQVAPAESTSMEPRFPGLHADSVWSRYHSLCVHRLVRMTVDGALIKRESARAKV